IACPRHRSAISEFTPARLIRDRAVRRRSCSRQPVAPDALSSSRLSRESPPTGRTPSKLKTISPRFGSVRSTACEGPLAILLGLIALGRQLPQISLYLTAPHLARLVAARAGQQ